MHIGALSKVDRLVAHGQISTQKVLGAFPVPIPNPDVARLFKKYVDPIPNKIVENIRESSTLASLRDTLLPKLISGELRIPDAEKFIEGAGL